MPFSPLMVDEENKEWNVPHSSFRVVEEEEVTMVEEEKRDVEKNFL